VPAEPANALDAVQLFSADHADAPSQVIRSSRDLKVATPTSIGYAVLSRIPIADVTRRLMDVANEYPDAEVRRGRANRWEVTACFDRKRRRSRVTIRRFPCLLPVILARGMGVV
jgi:hypothetical protein